MIRCAHMHLVSSSVRRIPPQSAGKLCVSLIINTKPASSTHQCCAVLQCLAWTDLPLLVINPIQTCLEVPAGAARAA